MIFQYLRDHYAKFIVMDQQNQIFKDRWFIWLDFPNGRGISVVSGDGMIFTTEVGIRKNGDLDETFGFIRNVDERDLDTIIRLVRALS